MSRAREPRNGSSESRDAPAAASGGPPTATGGRGSGGDACAGLDGLGDPAILVGDDHRILAANASCAAFFAGEEIVGRSCHQVFHHRSTPCERAGERCPVSRLRQTGEPWRAVHVHHVADGEEHHEVAIYPLPGNANGNGGGVTYLEILRPVTIASTRPCRDRLAGRSPAFCRMLELLLRVAPEATPVLLLGETGTGKRMAARALHRLSGKPRGAFADLSCAGLAGEALEHELYGRAAGTTDGEPGKVERAWGGTLFLDDVGELDAAGQRELLRLVKTGVYRRPGDVRLFGAHFRLVCGGHPNLPQRVDRGDFSSDLYFRIGAFPIELPALRQRREDLPLLAACEVERMDLEPRPEIDRRTFAVLARHAFPGNLRELRRILEHAWLEAGGGPIRPEHLPPELRFLSGGGGEAAGSAAERSD